MDPRQTYHPKASLALGVMGMFVAFALVAGCTPAPKFRGRDRSLENEPPGRPQRADTAAEPQIVLAAPVDDFTAGRITSPFGWRGQTRGRGSAAHEGVDIKARAGETVRAAAAGTISFSGRQRGYGNMIKINHGDGFITVYAHLFYASARIGQRVGAGEPIGRAGKRGTATGTHLHFEVRFRDAAIDPMRYLRPCLRDS